VLPDGFHLIRHYGLLANANRTNNIALARRLLGVPIYTWQDRFRDPALMVLLILDLCLIFVAALLARKDCR
jgi:hypothetical protein